MYKYHVVCFNTPECKTFFKAILFFYPTIYDTNLRVTLFFSLADFRDISHNCDFSAICTWQRSVNDTFDRCSIMAPPLIKEHDHGMIMP